MSGFPSISFQTSFDCSKVIFFFLPIVCTNPDLSELKAATADVFDVFSTVYGEENLSEMKATLAAIRG